ncbi:MAG: GNAT family N-acetyltransferase [Thiolinea sp.]
MPTDVLVVDYQNQQHAADMVTLMDEYSRHPMIHSKPLPDDIKQKLASELSQVPGAFSVICYVDDTPAGLTNCLQGFSTFKCQPLINIHDAMVSADFRGHGLTRKMFAKVEEVARERGCCKLTLEVLEKNEPARRAYQSIGFEGFALDPAQGIAHFWEKVL